MAEEKNKGPSLGWLALGGAVGVGLYFASKEIFRGLHKPFSMTTAAPIPPSQPPASFADLGAVDARFSDLRTLYHMYLRFDDTISEINLLENAVQRLSATDPARASTLLADLETFKGQVMDAKQFQASLKNNPA